MICLGARKKAFWINHKYVIVASHLRIKMLLVTAVLPENLFKVLDLDPMNKPNQIQVRDAVTHTFILKRELST